MSEQRSVVVTGAGGGIGRATAHAFAARGDRVVLADVNEEALMDAVHDIDGAIPVVADVSDAASCRHVIGEAERAFGGIDVLINNAAVGVFGKTVETTTEEEWDRTLAIDLKSVFLMSKFAIPSMRARGGGAIVNVSSIHAMATSTGVAPYVAAKAGVLGLTRNMALDLAADRIRVLAIIPGAVDTPMLHEHAARERTTLEALGFSRDPTAIGRIASPAELAKVVVFAASEDASAMTGSPIVVDAGLLAKF